MNTETPENPDTPSRVILPRRTLPSGRSVVGGLLVTLAATGAFLVATSADASGPTTGYVVLSTSIDAGGVVHTSDLVIEPMELADRVAERGLTSTDGVEGAVAMRDLRAGELLSADDLLASPDLDGRPIGAVHEITIPAPADRSPDQLRRGDRITVLSLVRDGDMPETVVAIEDAVVLGFEGGDGGFADDTVSLTLAIDDPAVVMEVAHLAHTGELTVVRSTRAIADAYPAGTTPRPEPLSPTQEGSP